MDGLGVKDSEATEVTTSFGVDDGSWGNEDATVGVNGVACSVLVANVGLKVVTAPVHCSGGPMEAIVVGFNVLPLFASPSDLVPFTSRSGQRFSSQGSTEQQPLKRPPLQR